MCVAAHSSFCGSLNVKDLATEDAAHLNLNGSLCKQIHTEATHMFSLYAVHFLVLALIDGVNYMRDLCEDQ